MGNNNAKVAEKSPEVSGKEKLVNYLISLILKDQTAEVLRILKKQIGNNFDELVNFSENRLENGSHKYTLLSAAAERGNIELANALLDYKAAIDQAHFNGLSPIFQAVRWGKVEMVDLLLFEGAEVTKSSYEGKLISEYFPYGNTIIAEKINNAASTWKDRSDSAAQRRITINTGQPATPPKTVHSDDSVKIINADIKVVLNPLSEAHKSSSENFVVGGVYYADGIGGQAEPINVKIKVSNDKAACELELKVLLDLKHSKLFIFPLHNSVLTKAAVQFSKGDSLAFEFYALVLEVGGSSLMKALWDEQKKPIADRRLAPGHLLDAFVDPVVRIVEQLHDLNWAWMDIKPENFLFVVRNGEKRLVGIDFDHARPLDAQLEKEYNFATIQYAPPEFLNINAEIRCTPLQFDMWSLGMTILTVMRSGNNPYNGLSVDSIKSKIIALGSSEDVGKFVVENLKGNDGNQSAVRKVLKDHLFHLKPDCRTTNQSVLPLLSPMAASGYVNQIVEKIDTRAESLRKQISGVAADVKATKKTAQRVDANVIHIKEMFESLDVMLGKFQGIVVTSFQALTTTVEIHDAQSVKNHLKLLECFKEVNETTIKTAANSEEVFKKQFDATQKYFQLALNDESVKQNAKLCEELTKMQFEIVNAHSKLVSAAVDHNSKEWAEMKAMMMKFGGQMTSTHKLVKEFGVVIDKMDKAIENNTKTLQSMRPDLARLSDVIATLQSELKVSGKQLTPEEIKSCIAGAMQDLSLIPRSAANTELLTAVTNALKVVRNETNDTALSNMSSLLDQFGSTIEKQTTKILTAQQRALIDIGGIGTKLDASQAVILSQFDRAVASVDTTVVSGLKSVAVSIQKLSDEALKQQLELLNNISDLGVKFDTSSVDSVAKLEKILNENVVKPLDNYFVEAKKRCDKDEDLKATLERQHASTLKQLSSLKDITQTGLGKNAEELKVMKVRLDVLMEFLTVDMKDICKNISDMNGLMAEHRNNLKSIGDSVTKLKVSGASDIKCVTARLDALAKGLEGILNKEDVVQFINSATQELAASQTDKNAALVEAITASLDNVKQESNLTAERIVELVTKIKSTAEESTKALLEGQSTIKSLVNDLHSVTVSGLTSLEVSLQGYDEKTVEGQREILASLEDERITNQQVNKANDAARLVEIINANFTAVIKYMDMRLNQAREDSAGDLSDAIQRQKDFLTTSLQQAVTSLQESTAGSFSEVKDETKASLEKMKSDVRKMIDGVGKEVAVVKNIAKTLVTGQFLVPRLMIILPKDPKTLWGTAKRWFVDVVQIYFICPVSLELGTPYSLSKPKEWVTKVAPVVKWSLIALKIALLALGLPALPIPVIPDFGACPLNELIAMASKSIKDAASELNNANNGQGISNISESIDACVDKLDTIQSTNEEMTNLWIKSEKALEGNYADIYLMLKELEGAEKKSEQNWQPKKTGLRRVSSKKGTTSWVLDTPDFVNQYYMYGNHALRIQDGSGNAPEATSSETDDK